ncbi:MULTISPECIES: acyl-CoA dehydrogenase family protein [unclassified Sphingobium]|uniref:acyl-CoA dehydrogenase family protein n=1 Tax=unclassified Sphingobium TaxID=2611147 RepID=UPI00076FF4BF|nr:MULTISPECIES: acyl-CoA dehydrogenase family protein [unclassified Sphingobium]AMK23690.1 isovaleryl-CoA dehydrogenase [Sphingobium sp. TKS]NML89452.1 acyl-CoA dehydrogenase [Sphingobium sp. TB-6]
MLNEEQQMLKDMASEWVRDRLPVTALRSLYGHDGGGRPDAEGYDPEAWAEMAQMGWAGILVPEAHGGSDFGYRSMGLVLEELGRTLGASPLLSSALVAASALRLGGTEAQQARWLASIADGSAIGTLAAEEGAQHGREKIALTATASGDGWVLNGVKRPVQDGMIATFAIIAARTGGAASDRDGITLFLVESNVSGLSRDTLDQIDARRPALFTFDNVAVGVDAVLGEVGKGADLLDALFDRAAIGLAAEMLGNASQAFDTTLHYLKTRVQFGAIIGSFQALQHRAAEMFGELQLARSAVEAALDAIDANDPALPALASLAKATMGETLHGISSQMVQLHGGIGMTHEHDAGLYLKRARVAAQCYGSTAWHRERWARLNGY